MILGIATPEHALYRDISCFARRVYVKKLGAAISATPDAFAYARKNRRIVGCSGIYRAAIGKKLLVETYFPAAFGKISGNNMVDRRSCAEIGTRAVVRTHGFRSVEVSLGLSAALLVYAHGQGVTSIGFTANRTVRHLARTLDIELITLGTPDISQVEETFRTNWKSLFRVRQTCFGLRVRSIDGCLATLEYLRTRGIHTNMPDADPA